VCAALLRRKSHWKVRTVVANRQTNAPSPPARAVETRDGRRGRTQSVLLRRMGAPTSNGKPSGARFPAVESPSSRFASPSMPVVHPVDSVNPVKKICCLSLGIPFQTGSTKSQAGKHGTSRPGLKKTGKRRPYSRGRATARGGCCQHPRISTMTADARRQGISPFRAFKESFTAAPGLRCAATWALESRPLGAFVWPAPTLRTQQKWKCARGRPFFSTAQSGAAEPSPVPSAGRANRGGRHLGIRDLHWPARLLKYHVFS
jgi:hypothetical protein